MTLERDELLNQCFQEAGRRAPPLLKRCIDAVISSLQAAEGASLHVKQRQLLARATWSLAQCRGLLVQQYAKRLDESFQRETEDHEVTALAGLSDSSMLELVDDHTINESLEAARLLQNLLPLVDHALPVLDARMSSLVGLDTISVEKNPLRPSVFARELRDLMAEMEGDTEIRVLWLQHIAHVLGRELGQLYEQLALMLQRANVQEASYRIRLVEDPEASRAASMTKDAPSDMLPPYEAGGANNTGGQGFFTMPAMGSLARANTALGSDVFQAFLSGPQRSFEAPLDAEYYDQVRDELRQVEAWAAVPDLHDEAAEQTEVLRYRDLPAVDRPSRAVNVESRLSSERWGEYSQAHARTRVLLELKARAQDASQAIGLDLVRKLVNQVARDSLLLAPVREAIVALEPALLRLALAQPRYFAEADHPARRLVEEVAQRSFRFNDEFSDGFEAFMAPVCARFGELNASPSEDAQPFVRALRDLSAGWGREENAEKAALEQQIRGLRFAEARQELADQIAWEISLRPDVFNAPALVLDYLYGTWSLVIASEELKPAGLEFDAQHFRSIVGTLLWSVRPETLRQPKQVFAALPGLLRTLNAGLDSLGKSREDTRAFFDALMRLHQPLLNLRRASASKDAPALDAAQAHALKEGEPIKRVLSNAVRPVVATQPWMAANEWADAGFEDTQAAPRELDEESEESDVGTDSRFESASEVEDSGFEAPSVAAQAARSTVPAEPDSAAAGLAKTRKDTAEGGVLDQAVQLFFAQLRVGCRVDMYSGGSWLRAELVWSSARGTLFMFTSPGGRAHSMTRRSCEKLIRSKGLRLAETRHVIEEALKQVAHQAARKRSDAAPVSAFAVIR
ncbi:DUF1631 family protein [Hydrogenophaga sp. PAMC20947]|uniref:DUF1631 family protein n=1 Tax=Hydrogenophaga sp. PAMC20947 TaxID=2565558 RepID=UPI00109E1E9A|nr:DUF1631 family protein [Hydrogenophaga sp. PAMC20947]QCB45792.1 DUF1631 family protein [Hydrogenophaga sp. PAMC20947]